MVEEPGFDGIGVVGINQIGYDAGNIDITDGRVAPWLQDTEEASVWAKWGINYRDVMLVDGERYALHVRNLSDVGLQNPDNYCDLATLIVEIQNGVEDIDVVVLDGSCPSGVDRPADADG